MWVCGDVTSERRCRVEKQLEICLKRIRKIDFKILEAKKLGKRIQELKYIRMLKSTSIHYEELKRMKYYLTT